MQTSTSNNNSGLVAAVKNEKSTLGAGGLVMESVQCENKLNLNFSRLCVLK